MSAQFIPIIICGGSGSRLWPRSRRDFAKPFVPLPGATESLIDLTYKRLCESPQTPTAVMTVAAANDLFLCEDSFAKYGPKTPHLLIGEPEGRNTAPAIATAVMWVRQRFGNDAAVLVLAADHIVGNAAAFWRAVAAATRAAQAGKIALLGIAPSYPSTGYGYIERGEALAEVKDVFTVRRFVEKPDAAKAQTFVANDNFLWNAGIFCFTPQTLFAELPALAPAVAAPLESLATQLPADSPWLPTAADYQLFPDISFDFAVMEKTANAAVAPAVGAQWSDVGSWRALGESSLAADARGNRTDSEALLLDCDNCLLVGDGGRLLAGIDLQDLLIIDSPDALLVAKTESAERAREVFVQLSRDGREEALTPRTVRRPWGSYTVLSHGEGYKIKRINVLPGERLSLQSHAHRSEHWTTIVGKMTVVINERTLIMAKDESCYIPLGAKHRMYNDTDELAAIIEVQVGDYLGEDDITRYEDIYGRG